MTAEQVNVVLHGDLIRAEALKNNIPEVVVDVWIEKGCDIRKYFNYDYYQLLELTSGVQEDLDITVYDDIRIDWVIMGLLRRGMKKGYDMKPYANPFITQDKLQSILDGLDLGLDVSKYSNLEYDSYYMDLIMTGLKRNIDLTKYFDEMPPYITILELRREFGCGTVREEGDILYYGKSKCAAIKHNITSESN